MDSAMTAACGSDGLRGAPAAPSVTPIMRFAPSTAANAVAWAVLIGLICVSFVLVVILGPFGLILLGLLTLFVCTSFTLREDTPTWGTEVFRARMERPTSPEQRAARQEEREHALAPVRFYRWCGVVLVVAGIAGFVWQRMQ
jgi:hypothetical protein